VVVGSGLGPPGRNAPWPESPGLRSRSLEPAEKRREDNEGPDDQKKFERNIAKGNTGCFPSLPGPPRETSGKRILRIRILKESKKKHEEGGGIYGISSRGLGLAT